ncbi:MAG: alpha/beta hydrolase family protein [Tepidiformaceae bacterium]
MHGFQVTGQAIIGALRQVRFSVAVEGERVPGTVYVPLDADAAMPLVLIQHPGMGSKDDYFVDEPAKVWAQRGWVCGGIDAPLHGERDEHDPMRVFRDPGAGAKVAAQFAAELTATVDALAEELTIDLSRLGYVGYSLGAMLGVRALAGDGRFRAAALCLVGEGGLLGPARGEGSVLPGLAGVAVRILGKTADELIPRAATEALYDALPGEKDLVWLAGGHFEIGDDVIRAAGEWLRQRL